MTGSVSQESSDALMGVLTNLIASAATPEIQQASAGIRDREEDLGAHRMESARRQHYRFCLKLFGFSLVLRPYSLDT